MSEAPRGQIEIVRRLIGAWRRASEAGVGIAEVLAADRDLFDPEVEWVNPPEAVDGGTRRGFEGWLTAAQNLADALGVTRMEIERIEEAGDVVVAAAAARGKAPGSGVEMTYPARGTIWRFRDGRLACFEWLVSVEDAFARIE